MPLRQKCIPGNEISNQHVNMTLVNTTYSCSAEDIMRCILSDASSYLYPFIVEYSLIGAAFLYVMWSTIGTIRKSNHEVSSTPNSPSMPGLQIDDLSCSSSSLHSPSHYNCLGSSKGLFCNWHYLFTFNVYFFRTIYWISVLSNFFNIINNILCSCSQSKL